MRPARLCSRWGKLSEIETERASAEASGFNFPLPQSSSLALSIGYYWCVKTRLPSLSLFARLLAGRLRFVYLTQQEKLYCVFPTVLRTARSVFSSRQSLINWNARSRRRRRRRVETASHFSAPLPRAISRGEFFSLIPPAPFCYGESGVFSFFLPYPLLFCILRSCYCLVPFSLAYAPLRLRTRELDFAINVKAKLRDSRKFRSPRLKKKKICIDVFLCGLILVIGNLYYGGKKGKLD